MRRHISSVRITHHGDEHVPVSYQIQTWDGSEWVTQVSATGNSAARCRRPPDYNPQSGWTCMIQDDFPSVLTSKVRFTFDNCGQNILGTAIIHGWIYEFEALTIPG
jgi:hypothetical protein